MVAATRVVEVPGVRGVILDIGKSHFELQWLKEVELVTSHLPQQFSTKV